MIFWNYIVYCYIISWNIYLCIIKKSLLICLLISKTSENYNKIKEISLCHSLNEFGETFENCLEHSTTRMKIIPGITCWWILILKALRSTCTCSILSNEYVLKVKSTCTQKINSVEILPPPHNKLTYFEFVNLWLADIFGFNKWNRG